MVYVTPSPRRMRFARRNKSGGGRREHLRRIIWSSGPLVKVLLIALLGLLVLVLLGLQGESSQQEQGPALSIKRHYHLRHKSRLSSKELDRLTIDFPPSPKDLDRLNSQLVDTDDILKWAVQQFSTTKSKDGHHQLVQITSFGPSGLVILDKLNRLGYLGQVPVVTIDTLHLFSETYDFVSRVQQVYGTMDLQAFRPNGFEDRESFDKEYGIDFWRNEPKWYGYLTKVEPMERALDQLEATAWITGRRRSQGGERANLQVFEMEESDDESSSSAAHQRLKINPLAHWSYDDVWEYIRKHNIPYNPLHDKGYKSIGDVMTTISVAPDADERSGRFVGLNKTECGMHSHLERIKNMRPEDKTTLPCPDCIDVDVATFDKLVMGAVTDMLLEFYSPLCGGCQEFAPEYTEIATSLKHIKGIIQVARYDITDNEITDSMTEAGFDVEVTPSLYLVQRNPFQVSLYEGEHHMGDILEWLEKKNPSIKIYDPA